jgi:peptidoglycan-associated lipoprotein
MLVLFAIGCKKKAPPPPPPPPPPPKEAPAPKPRPIVKSFTAEPTSIQRGQSATLRWEVQGADSISIDNGIGTVNAAGSRQVYPSSSTQYRLTARNESGEVSATARVNVAEPPPAPPPPEAPKPRRTLSEALAQEVQDVYFDYDKYDIREDARAVLSRNADALKRILAEFPSAAITMEGHCDERGSAEYNLGLGDRRASSAKEFLGQFGLPGDRLRPISYGKERPQCTESNEDCWQKNRRVHFSAGQ